MRLSVVVASAVAVCAQYNGVDSPPAVTRTGTMRVRSTSKPATMYTKEQLTPLGGEMKGVTGEVNGQAGILKTVPKAVSPEFWASVATTQTAPPTPSPAPVPVPIPNWWEAPATPAVFDLPVVDTNYPSFATPAANWWDKPVTEPVPWWAEDSWAEPALPATPAWWEELPSTSTTVDWWDAPAATVNWWDAPAPAATWDAPLIEDAVWWEPTLLPASPATGNWWDDLPMEYTPPEALPIYGANAIYGVDMSDSVYFDVPGLGQFDVPNPKNVRSTVRPTVFIPLAATGAPRTARAAGIRFN